MVPQIGNEVRLCEFCRKLLLPRLRPLSVNELKEIKADPHAIDAAQIREVFDVIDVTIQSALFCSRAHENGVGADHSAAFTDHLDLFITDVAFDVVVSANIRVWHDWRLCCDRENLFKSGWIDVRKINDYTERLALLDHFATERSQTFSR